MEQNFPNNLSDIEKLIAQKEAALAAERKERQRKEMAIANKEGSATLAIQNAKRAEKGTKVMHAIKARAENLRNQIRKILQETNSDVRRELSKGEAEESMREFERAYARIAESLAADANALTPAQIKQEAAKSLGRVKAMAQEVSDKHGVPMGSFPDFVAPEKEQPVEMTGTTKWEANTATDENGNPYYKPYVAPKVSDYPEYKPWETPKEEKQKWQPGPGEEVDTDWKRQAENIKSKMPEIDPKYAPTIELKAMILDALKRENLNFDTAMPANKAELMFRNSQNAAELDRKIAELGEKLGFSETELRNLARQIAAENGLEYPDPDALPPEEPAKDDRSYFEKMRDEAANAVPGFEDLTEGQQDLVLKGIHNRVLTSIQEGAENDFKERIANQNWAGRTWSRMWEKTITKAYEKRAFMELGGTEPEPKKGLWNRFKQKISPYEKIWKEGLDTPPEESQILRGEFLAASGDISNVVKQSGIDVAYYQPVFNERGAIAKDENGEYVKGEPVVNYAPEPDILARNTDPTHPNLKVGEIIQNERSFIVYKYNEAATNFANIPQEWGTPDAKRSQRKAHAAALEAYNEAKAAYLEEVAKFEREQHANDPEEKAQQAVSDSQAIVETMQYLFAHPDVADDLEAIGEHSALRLGMGTDATKERGMLMAGSAVSRNLMLKSAPLWNGFALIAAPLTGAATGAARSIMRSNKEFRRMGRQARRGERVNGKLAFGMGNVTRHIERMNNYMERIDAARDPDEYRQLISEFRTRIDFIETKNELGQINVGTDLATQYEFKRLFYKSKLVLEAGEKQDEIRKVYEESGFLFTDIKKRGEQIAHEPDPAKRKKIISEVYAKYPELAGLWQDDRVFEDVKKFADQAELGTTAEQRKKGLEAAYAKYPELTGLLEGTRAYEEIMSIANAASKERLPARREKIIEDAKKNYPEIQGLLENSHIFDEIKIHADKIEKLKDPKYAKEQEKAFQDAYKKYPELQDLWKKSAQFDDIRTLTEGILSETDPAQQKKLITEAYKKYPGLNRLVFSDFKDRTEEIMKEGNPTRRVDLVNDVYATYPELTGLWSHKTQLDDVTERIEGVANETNPAARHRLIQETYAKYPGMRGLWESARVDEKTDDIEAILDKASAAVEAMDYNRNTYRYKIGQIFGDIRLTQNKLAHAFDSHHHIDPKKQAEILNDFNEKYPDFEGIWKILPGDEISHDGHVVNPFDGKRAAKRAANIIRSLRANREPYELNPYQATGRKVEFYRQAPHLGIGRNEIPLGKAGEPLSRIEAIETPDYPLAHTDGTAVLNPIRDVELRHNVGRLIGTMGGRNQEAVRKARAWKKTKDAARSAVLGAMFSEIFLADKTYHAISNHVTAPIPHQEGAHLPPAPEPRGPVAEVPTPPQPAQPSVLPEVKIPAPRPEAPIEQPKIHFDLRRDNPDLETELPKPVETSPHGVPRFRPDTLFRNAPARPAPGSSEVYVSYNEGVQQPGNNDVYVSYNEGAPQNQDVAVSYEHADDFVIPGKEGHIGRVAERLLDKDFGTHHFLGIGRHTSHMPEWKAIEGVPVKYALLDDAGSLVHAHKQFFDTLRTHGLENNVLPNKDETVGSYVERVYRAMARAKTAGTTEAATPAPHDAVAPATSGTISTAPAKEAFGPQPDTAPVDATQAHAPSTGAAPSSLNEAVPAAPKPATDIEFLDIDQKYNALLKANPDIQSAYKEMRDAVINNKDGSSYRAVGIAENADLASAERTARGDAIFNALKKDNFQFSDMKIPEGKIIGMKTYDLPNGHHVAIVTEEIPKNNLVEALPPAGPASTFEAANTVIGRQGYVEVSSGDVVRKLLSKADNMGQLPLRRILEQNDGKAFTVVRSVGQTEDGARLSAEQMLRKAGETIRYSRRDQIYTFTEQLDNGNVAVYEIRSHNQ